MKWLSLFTVLLLVTSCSIGGKSGRGRSEKIVHNHSLLTEEKWGIKLVTVDGEFSTEGTMKGLRHLNLEYYSNQLMEVEEAREAVTDTLEGLLRALNRDEQLRPNLLEYPLTVENLTMRLSLEHFFGDYFEPIYIGLVKVEDGYITYYTHNNKIKQREPYNKALRHIGDSEEQQLRDADRMGEKAL